MKQQWTCSTDGERRTLTIGTAVIPYSCLDGYELVENGRIIARGGNGIARVVTEYSAGGGAALRERLRRLPGWNNCRSLRLRILRTDAVPVIVDLIGRPVSRKAPAYLEALRFAREAGAAVTSVVDMLEEERIADKANHMLDFTKGRERSTAAAMAEHFERYRRGEITADELQRIKLQLLLDPLRETRGK